MKAVVLAGGLGTRLRPLTYVMPKAMLPVGDKPIIEHIIVYLASFQMIDEIIIATAYLGRYIEDYLNEGEDWDISIKYARGKRPLGTAGQLKTAESFIDDTFVLINGDILIEVVISDMIKFHKSKGGTGTIALKPYFLPVKYGVIDTDADNLILNWREKPNIPLTMNIGLYVLEPKIFDYIPPDRAMSLEREVFPKIIASGEKLYGFKTETNYLDIGDLESLDKAHQEFLSKFTLL
ncbi:nucleotidyltransferase family protein [Candidatus Borrarchaeum sp.]|uniref:nucleotidyltransferase family protein n=1 Tax=Candidatus Borrarchaeum sp. TaxID=2846742 RepID=UPI00257C489A|nr:nucleotidyltransferase family protein [Candidatus Borrarchaeum sp.]